MQDKVVDLFIILAIMLSALAMTWVIMRQIRLSRRESADSARLEAENGTLRGELATLAERVAALERSGPDPAALTERVAVLERIVTDPAARTASEIESLRTLPRPSGPGER